MILVDSSLIQNVATDDDGHRFRMLEPIREYAQEHLGDRVKDTWMHHRFATYYVALMEAAEPVLTGGQQQMWLMLLEREHSNLHAALTWLLKHGSAEDAARLVTAARPFWVGRGHLSEGRRWRDLILLSAY